MQSENPGGLLIISVPLQVGVDNSVALGFANRMMIFGARVARSGFKKVFRQVLRQNPFRNSKHDGPLHSVFELAYITWPSILDEYGFRFRREALELALTAFTRALQEIA